MLFPGVEMNDALYIFVEAIEGAVVRGLDHLPFLLEALTSRL